MNELKGRERYQQKRNDYCANMVASTSQTYQDFVQTARELSRTLENLNTTLFLTNQCVDSTYLLSHRSEYESLLTPLNFILAYFKTPRSIVILSVFVKSLVLPQTIPFFRSSNRWIIE